MAFICQEDKSLLENIHFSQISQASKNQKFRQNPKRINKKSTLIIVFTVFTFLRRLKRSIDSIQRIPFSCLKYSQNASKYKMIVLENSQKQFAIKV